MCRHKKTAFTYRDAVFLCAFVQPCSGSALFAWRSLAWCRFPCSRCFDETFHIAVFKLVRFKQSLDRVECSLSCCFTLCLDLFFQFSLRRDKKRIELLMRQKTGLQFWYLDEEKISGYKGISDEVRKQEREHKAFMQQEEQRAQGYKSVFA